MDFAFRGGHLDLEPLGVVLAAVVVGVTAWLVFWIARRIWRVVLAGSQLQAVTRHVPQEARPHEQPEVPPQEEELEHREAYEPQLPTSQRRPPRPVHMLPVPRRRIERDLRAIDDEHAHAS